MDRSRLILASYVPTLLDLLEGQRSAAVLIPIYRDRGRYHVLFTKRSDEVEYHKGQISFPGGGHEPADPDLKHTALRETHEEIGVHPDDIEVIGQLDDIVTISDFRVRPYVGLIMKSPYDFVYDRHEVASILPVPAAHLVNELNTRSEFVRMNGERVPVRSYQWEEHVIFGATALIMQSFLSLLEREGSIEELVYEALEERA